jgi:polar amino acid transport system substrate-binding protein
LLQLSGTDSQRIATGGGQHRYARSRAHQTTGTHPLWIFGGKGTVMSGLGRPARLSIAIASVVLVGLTLSACASSKKSTSSGGAFTYCTDPTYPPAEFYQAARRGAGEVTKTLAGADIDIGKAVAKRLGGHAEFVTTPFADIIGSLLDKKCDAIISFINDTASRRKQMAFADYAASGQSVLVKNGSPVIHEVSDLFGKTVSVARGTTEEQFLISQNNAANGKPPIKILSFASDDDAIYALTQDAAEVYFGDTPVVSLLVSQNSALTQGPEIVKAIPVGIALRTGDSRLAGTKKAISDMYADGTMGTILAKWKLTPFAITP